MHLLGGGGRDAGVKDQVRTIREGICLAKHITKKPSKVVLQVNWYMEKVKSRALTETAVIKAEVESTFALVNKIDQGQRRLIETLKNEVDSLKGGIIDAPCL